MSNVDTCVFPCRGTSMLPSILPGSDLLVEPAEASAARVGDIVSYLGEWSGQSVVTHRVVAIEDGPDGRVLVTRGDNCSHDERVPASALAFRVLRVIRGPLSYSTDEPVGRAIARLALRGGLLWRALRWMTGRLLLADTGPFFPVQGAARHG